MLSHSLDRISQLFSTTTLADPSATAGSSIVAAPGAGRTIYVTDLIWAGGTQNISLMSDSASSVLIDRLPVVGAPPYHIPLNAPVSGAANTDIGIINTATLSVTIIGYIA